jgi:hypothetical protein
MLTLDRAVLAFGVLSLLAAVILIQIADLAG